MMDKKYKTYSESMQELQMILDKIESGDLDVDVLAEELKKASTLLKFCKEKLYKTDAEVKKILDNLDL